MILKRCVNPQMPWLMSALVLFLGVAALPDNAIRYIKRFPLRSRFRIGGRWKSSRLKVSAIWRSGWTAGRFAERFSWDFVRCRRNWVLAPRRRSTSRTS